MSRRSRSASDSKRSLSYRIHKSHRFRCSEPGRWRCRHLGREWELERRRSEPGAPAGWYVFGPGTEGRRAGPGWSDAADLVVELSASAIREGAS